MKTMNEYGLTEISREESVIIGGGSWPVMLAVGLYLLSEFDSICEGVADSLNGKDYDYKG